MCVKKVAVTVKWKYDIKDMVTVKNAPSKSQLHKLYESNPNQKLLAQLIDSYQRLVHKVAHQIKHQCAEEYEDLFQLGVLGLIKAINRFKPEQNTAFSSFAVPYIKGAMLHHLRDHGTSVKVPRKWHEIYSKYRSIQRQEEALDEEVTSKKLGIPVECLREIKQACQSTRSAAKELPINICSSGRKNDFDYTNAPEYIEQITSKMRTKLKNLPQTDQKIIQLLYIQALPHEQAAIKLKITQQELMEKAREILLTLSTSSLDTQEA